MKFLILVIALCFSSANAASVNLVFSVNPSCYDYVAREDCASPESALVTVNFPLQPIVSLDYGTTTITQFGDVLGTSFSSPFRELLPFTLESGHYGGFYNSYTFPNVSDYSDTFLEEFAVQANTFAYYSADGEDFARAYHIEFRITTRSQSRGGSGSEDYAFGAASVLDFLHDARDGNAPVYFNESYADFKYLEPSGAEYIDGRSWSDYGARLVSVSVIPEPSTLALFAIGTMFLTARKRL